MPTFLSPEILATVGAIIAVVVSFLAGGSRQKHKDRAERAEADKDAILKRKELEDEVEKLDPYDRRERLAKWVREGK
jgi:sensor domain CHASE-containing protein